MYVPAGYEFTVNILTENTALSLLFRDKQYGDILPFALVGWFYNGVFGHSRQMVRIEKGS